MQVHERMSTNPRGQLRLLHGDFNARVGSLAAVCLRGHAPVTENQNGDRMRELLTENNMVALNTFFPGDPYTWTKVSGKPARLDYICASSELLAATRWAGVRKDIDVRVGSAEDHWPVVAVVHLSTGEPRENRRNQSNKDRILRPTSVRPMGGTNGLARDQYICRCAAFFNFVSATPLERWTGLVLFCRLP